MTRRSPTASSRAVPRPRGQQTRPQTAKQEEISQHLLDMIISGDLRPGDKVRARTELESQFVASSVTVHRALSRLIDDGFIVTKGRHGTFVADRPPHLCRYVLAFPERMVDPGWNRFWTVMTNVARCLEETLPVQIAVYTGIKGREGSRDYLALLRDIRARRLAGIIFAARPFDLEGTPLLDEQTIPRVAVMLEGEYGMPGVGTSGERFLERALDRLAESSRTRVAMLTAAPLSSPEHFRSALADRGMTSRPGWVQTANTSYPESIVNTMLLMMDGPEDSRPDGIVVTDDNIVEHACLGLFHAGVSPSKDVDVVAHCNYPAPAPSMLPIVRLGYDIGEFLGRCIEIIDMQRAGKAPPAFTAVPPIFEYERQGGAESTVLRWPEKTDAPTGVGPKGT